MTKIVFTMGESQDAESRPIEVTVVVKRTWYNRFRFWLFFKFFPFDLKEWRND